MGDVVLQDHVELKTQEGDNLPLMSEYPLVKQLINQAVVKIKQLEKVANDEGTKAFVYKEELHKCKKQLKRYRDVSTETQRKLAEQVKFMKTETRLVKQEGYRIRYNEDLIKRLKQELVLEYGE